VNRDAMKKILLRLINPVELIKAWLYHRKVSKYGQSTDNLELLFYSKILKNDMLHYGYFEDPDIEPDSISIRALEEAQIKYSQNIIDKITDLNNPILDIGCGMGGLSNLIAQKGLQVEALSPDENQIKHIKSKYPNIKCYKKRFQNFDTDNVYGTLINSESFQYIPLNKAFEKADKLVKPGGTWIIVDYFRINDSGINKSSHLLEDVIQKTKEHGWEITCQQDITPNILPTIKMVYMYAERFMLPVIHFSFEKIRVKKAWLYYYIRDIKELADEKIYKELASVDPVKFENEKKYLFLVLRKKA
jgi:cyclopropane fatty-acyl-phospholipid synthase-like methyltransferase